MTYIYAKEVQKKDIFIVHKCQYKNLSYQLP